MSIQHTPGPWTANKTPLRWEVRLPNAHVDVIDYSASVEANARLIAAAPELLEALTKIRDWAQVAVSLDCPIPPKTRNRILKVARAAITKATGEESA